MMNVLLDTHTLLWWINEHDKLSPIARSVLLDEENTLFLSIASIWEIAIKVSLGKLTELEGGVSSVITKIEEMPIYMLPVLPNHIEMVESLPFIHRDPFDRLLIATANVEGMTILTKDDNITKYDAQTLWC